MLCCTGEEDQQRFVLFYARPCNLNLYFHPDSHNFAECTALSAHTLRNLVPPFVTVLLSQFRETSPLLSRSQLRKQHAPPSCPLTERPTSPLAHSPRRAGLLCRGLFKRDPRSEQFLKHYPSPGLLPQACAFLPAFFFPFWLSLGPKLIPDGAQVLYFHSSDGKT